MKETEDRGWSPYFAGALSGLVTIFSVLIAGHFIGASTTFVRVAGMIEKLVDPEKVKVMDYFVKFVPQIDWQVMFIIGIFIGSLIASTTSKTFRFKGLPDMWERRFGKSPIKRGLVAFIGGIIAMFGARLADG
jgi:hypothetical protein